MSINSSYSSNTSGPATHPIFFYYSELQTCFFSTDGSVSIIMYTVINNLLLFPLFSFAICVWLHLWWQRRKMTHSDVLTSQTVFAELIGIFGSTIICSGSLFGMERLMLIGIYCLIAYHFIVITFHVLTCADRYLAVVHPIIYVGLRKEKGIRIRNASIGCTWLLACTEAGIALLIKQSLSIYTTTIVTLNLVVVSFFSCSVLRILLKPRPGRGGGSRQLDALKLRAFYIICVVLVVLLVRFGFNICATVIISISEIGDHTRCALWMSSFWFAVPSRLVSPLVFLHGKRKMCCRNKTSRQ